MSSLALAPETELGCLIAGLIPRLAQVLGTVRLMRTEDAQYYAPDFTRAMKNLNTEKLDRIAELLEHEDARRVIDALIAFRTRSPRSATAHLCIEGEIPRKHSGAEAPSHNEELVVNEQTNELVLIEEHIMLLFQIIASGSLAA